MPGHEALPAPDRAPDATRRWRTVAAGLLLALAGAGCAAPELVWQRVDDAIIDRADDWLDLDPEQEQRLHARLGPWLLALRRGRLGDYAAFLRGLADRVEAGIEPADLHWANARFEALYTATVESFLPVITPTLAGLSPAQRAHLANRIDERNRDYREDYIDGHDGGRYALAERIIEAVERWTDTLDPNQHDLVHDRVRQLPRTLPGWYRWRRHMQQRLLTALERGASAAQVEHILHQWWIGRGRDSDRVRAGVLRDGLLETLAVLGASLTSAQRLEAAQRMRTRAGYLQTLADNSATGRSARTAPPAY